MNNFTLSKDNNSKFMKIDENKKITEKSHEDGTISDA